MEEIINGIEYNVYENAINIDLFNKIIAFINETSPINNNSNVYDSIAKKCIWNKCTDSLVIKEEYQFQYFGEILERYEERIGKDIRDIRAIALALGYATNFIDESMIVGTQLINFINKIKNLAFNDIYLKASLYLYDNQKFFVYAEELFNKTYTNTEEIIFLMSVFYDRLEEFFKKNRQQIINLLGINRNMQAFGNVRVYAWTIKNLYLLINKDRKKDIAVLKALIKLPTGFYKENSNVYKKLIESGYTEQEILYLNYLVLYYNPVPQSVQLSYSIVAEKIATDLCKNLINSEETHNEEIYALIGELLQKYKKYQIKCYGYTGIKLALQDDINIVNPITFSKLYYDFDGNLYSFDILNEKWDIVANQMEDNQYQELFDRFLIVNDFSQEKTKKCIDKYEDLTGKKYMDSFLKYDDRRMLVFDFLINKRVFLLKDIYEKNLLSTPKKQNEYLKRYIREVENKKSFEFLKYILRLNKLNISEINNIGFKFEEMVRGYSYDYVYLSIERPFLSKKEYKILLDCIERFIFYNKPSKYLDFIRSALDNDIVCKVYNKFELRKIYLLLCDRNPNVYKTEKYQQRYLTEEELNHIYNEKRMKEELEKQREIKEAKEYIENQFMELKDKNNFISLYNFYDRYRYKEKYSVFLTEMIKKYILKNIEYFRSDINEYFNFSKLMSLLLRDKKITTAEFAKITFEYTKLEVEKNEYNDSTFSTNN